VWGDRRAEVVDASGIAEIVGTLNSARAELLAQVKGATVAEATWKPAPEEWTISKIVGHVPYWEKWYLSHVERALGTGKGEFVEGAPEVEPATLEAGLEEMKAVRARSIARIERLSEKEVATKAEFGGYGVMTVGELLGKMAAHDLDHANQIAANRAAFRASR
jgi:hypothetical protein